MSFPSYFRTSLDLSTARDKERLVIQASYLEISHVADPIEIRLGSPNAEPILIESPRTFCFQHSVDAIYITHSAALGTVEFVTTDEFTSSIGPKDPGPLLSRPIPDGTIRERVGGYLYPRLAGGTAVITGSVGNVSAGILVNLAASPVLLEVVAVRVIEEVFAGSHMNVTLSNSEATGYDVTNITQEWWDHRIDDLTNPNGKIGHDQILTVIPGENVGAHWVASSTVSLVDEVFFMRAGEHGLLVPPGHTCYFGTALTNKSIRTNIWWIEHLLDA